MEILKHWTTWLALACCLGSYALAYGQAAKSVPQPATAKATFAGGCFWCMEPPYDKLPGVISTTSGYMGGKTKNPTYEQVSTGSTGHAESVQVEYDPAKVSYAQLLEVFWHNIDPTQRDAQFCDHGTQYRTADLLSQRRAEKARRSLESGAAEEQAFQRRHRHRDHRGGGVLPAPRNTTRISTRRTGALQGLPQRPPAGDARARLPAPLLVALPIATTTGVGKAGKP